MSTITFENVCRAQTKRQVIIKMNKFNMFITAVCALFFIQRHYSQAIKNDFFHELFLLKTKKKAIVIFLSIFWTYIPRFLFMWFNKVNPLCHRPVPPLPEGKEDGRLQRNYFFQYFSSSATTWASFYLALVGSSTPISQTNVFPVWLPTAMSFKERRKNERKKANTWKHRKRDVGGSTILYPRESRPQQ